MTTEVDLCTDASVGVEKVGGECNGAEHRHEKEEELVNLNGKGKEEGDGSFVLLTVKDGVGGCTDDPVVEADFVVKSFGQAGKGSMNGEEEEEAKAENEVNGNCIIEEYVNGVEVLEVEKVQGIVADDAEQNQTVVTEELERGSVAAGELEADIATTDASDGGREHGSVVAAESEGLLVDAAVGNGGSSEQNGAVVSEEQEHENVAVAESEGLLVDAAVGTNRIGEQKGIVVSEEQEHECVAESEGLLVDAAGEQNGTVVSEEQEQVSIAATISEELLLEAEVADSSAPREHNGTVISEEEEQESVIVADTEELLVDAEVTDSSALSDQNGTVVSEEQEHESVTVAETEKLLVGAEVADCNVPSDQNGAVVSEEQESESVTVAETEKLLVDAEVADSSVPRDQNGAVVSEEHEHESVASAETDELLVGAAVTNNSAEEHVETVVSKEQEHENVAAAQTEELLVDASVTIDSAEEQTEIVVSKEHEHETVAAGESEELLSVAAVENDSAGEQNGKMVAEEQQQVSIGAAQSDAILVDAVMTDSGADGEQNGTVVSEEQVQGNIAVAAESEALLVDAGEENGIGSAEQAQESQNGTVVTVDSESAGDIDQVSTVAEQIEVQSNGCQDCNAPILDAGKFDNVVESDLSLAGHAQVCNAVGDEKARNMNENHLVSTEQSEESMESKILVSYVEPELCQLNNDDDVKDNQECVVSGAPIDLEQEKKPGELANNLALDGVPAKGEMDFEQNRKAVLSGNLQSEIVKEDSDHLEKECVNDPIAATINKTEGGLNSEIESDYIPTAADSNMPEEVNENNCEGTKGQPTNADVSSDMETNTVDLKRVDIELLEKSDKDVICENLAESETSVLVEDADDGEDQLVETASELVEETQVVDESKNEVSQVPEDESSKDGEPQRVDEGEAQLVETTRELVEEAQVVDESKNEVAQVPEDESSRDGVAQQAEVACEVVEKALQGSKNEVSQVAEVETSENAIEAGEGGSKNEGKSDSEATDIQHAEANTVAESGESKELMDEGSVNELKVHPAELKTEVGEMGQPADADSPFGPPVEKKPFHFLIRIPRFDDEKVRDEITNAQLKVDEKTEARKSIASELQLQRNICKDLRNTFHGCLEEQKKLRDLHRSKRQEMDSQQSLINKARDAISIDDIDEKIRNMKHMVEHESLNLKEEKQYVREIEKLKQTRDDLSANMGKQENVHHALEQKDQVEKQLKLLRKEADLLREKLVKAQDITTAARKKLDAEAIKLQQLQAAFNDADGCRQKEYLHVQNLWGPLNEKNKYFRKYKDDVKAAYNYTSGEREALEQHCVNQVETFMELWNNNDEFRRDYVKSNLRSTLRRLGTHDGRSLGPDEEPPVIPNAVIYKKTLPIVSATEEKKEKEKKAAFPPLPLPLPLESDKSVNANDKVKVAKTQKQIKDVPDNKFVATSKTAEIEPDPLVSSSKSVSGTDKVEQVSEEVTVTVVEDETSKKMEELRKEEEAARLKEQLRLEQIAKAKEAMERKKQKAEKAQARAALRAKKEEEKRAKKMEKKKAAVVETTERTVNGETTAREAPVAITNEVEQQDKPSTVTKRSSKPLRFTKSKSIPPPLRNRSKRRMQSWMWFPVLALAVLALFWLGNHDLLSTFSLPKFGH